MKKIAKILVWLLPALFALLSLTFYSFGGAYRFTALMFAGIGAVLVLYILLSGLRRRQLMTAKVLSTVFTSVLLLGICIVLVTGALVLRAGYVPAPQETSYILVLGAKVNGTAPSGTLGERIRAAAAYLQSHPEAIAVVSGGQGPDEGISEAQCMYNYLTDMDIDPDRIWMEDRATSTWENLQFSLDLIEQNTGTRPLEIGLVSNEFHIFRATLFARDCGVAAVPIPASTTYPAIRLNYTLREVAGVWHYLILGGQYND